MLEQTKVCIPIFKSAHKEITENSETLGDLYAFSVFSVLYLSTFYSVKSVPAII
jgi:hypothetical protein